MFTMSITNRCLLSIPLLCRSQLKIRRLSSSGSEYFAPLTTRMLPDGSFEGKVAFITGGGTGLGKGLAHMLSALGAKVAISSRNEAVLKQTSEEISSCTGNEVLAFSADVRDSAAVKDAASQCVERLGLPNIIVNNAAGNFISPTERLSPNAFRTIIDIVLLGTANVTLEFGKRLIEAKQGASFLAISATYTQLGSAYVVPSATAKAGVEAMTRSLASEWAKYGMRFNGLALGPIETKGAFSRLDPTGKFAEGLMEQVPVGRLGEVEEFANLATYMVSNYASWLNGEVIQLDGGQLPNMSGMFNGLSKVTKEQWDMLENMIRKTKGS